MRTVVLDGFAVENAISRRIRTILLSQLASQNHAVQVFTLRENKIGNCAGDFFCWVRSPGVCNTNDDNRVIAAAIASADLLVYLTPLVFGGYGATLKQAVDHQIQNISPFFTVLNGETHHAKRYDHYADFLVIGWQPAPNAGAERIFRNLVWRNSLNFHAPASWCEIVTGDPTQETLAAQIASALAAIVHRRTLSDAVLLVPAGHAAQGSPPRRALVLVGSPRGRQSTSYAIGHYLLQQLAAHGAQTDIVCLYPLLNNSQKREVLLDCVDAADVTVLAFPIYVDSLPAPDIMLLERLAAHRAAYSKQGGGFAALANCGFPEAHHAANALAVCAEFAAQAGFIWQGGLALGAGEGLVRGRPLNELDGRVFPLKNALILAAEALGRGQPIPCEAQRLINRPFVPAWLYRVLGAAGWRQQARRWGAQNELKRKPYGQIRS